MKAKMFQSFMDLKASLGKVDAAFAYVTLCMRHYEDAAKASGDKVQFMKDATQRHHVRVNIEGRCDPSEHVFWSALVAVNAEWERFLSGLLHEIRLFPGMGGVNAEKGTKETWYECLLRNMDRAGKHLRNQLPAYLADLVCYLHDVRTAYVHKKAPSKQTRSLFRRLKDSRNTWGSEFGQWQMSPDVDRVGFDDVVIHTIATKLLAEIICNFVAPDPVVLLEHPDTRAFITREGGAVTRSAIRLFFFDRFGVDRDLAEMLAGRCPEVMV